MLNKWATNLFLNFWVVVYRRFDSREQNMLNPEKKKKQVSYYNPSSP